MAPDQRARGALVAALIACVGAVHGAEPATAARTDERFALAAAAYERNHWSQAYEQFAAGADEGHAESARIALQMWRHGRALYRTDFSASAQQVERWTRMWACNGGARCTHAPLQAP